MPVYTQKDFTAILDAFRKSIHVQIHFITPLAGGLPGNEEGITSFVQYYLKLIPGTPEFDSCVERIKSAEAGIIDTTPEEGEVEEEKSYSVSIIRRHNEYRWIAEHQIKALLKQAASRLGIFNAKRGSKGDIAEMTAVKAISSSVIDPDALWQIGICDKNGHPARSEFVCTKGNVTGPSGKRSIVTYAECIQDGYLSFDICFPENKLVMKDMLEILAAASQIGLGSKLSIGNGKFEIISAEYEEKKAKRSRVAELCVAE
jgi:hypothetical protein